MFKITKYFAESHNVINGTIIFMLDTNRVQVNFKKL